MREKPSERLQFALDALIEAERPDAPVKPFMSFYHHIDIDGTCFACLGGLAAIKRYDLNPRKGYGSDEEVYSSGKAKPTTIERYECSLDYFRQGDVSNAFDSMGYKYEAGEPFNRTMPYYSTQKSEFKEAIRKLIADLQTAGY